MECGVFKEDDLETDGNDLTEIGWCAEVLTAGAEMGEAKVAGSSELEA